MSKYNEALLGFNSGLTELDEFDFRDCLSLDGDEINAIRQALTIAAYLEEHKDELQALVDDDSVSFADFAEVLDECRPILKDLLAVADGKGE